MTYEKRGTHKLRRSAAFKDWRRFISGKEKWQAQILRKKNIPQVDPREVDKTIG